MFNWSVIIVDTSASHAGPMRMAVIGLMPDRWDLEFRNDLTSYNPSKPSLCRPAWVASFHHQ
jgi:hypothetical protein